MRILLVLCLLLQLSPVSGQKKQAAVWIYGLYNKVDFSFSPAKFIYSPPAIAEFGAATICDSNGNLQFYAEGDIIRNRVGGHMVNFQTQYPQYSGGQHDCNLIVPFQHNPYLYHYFSLRDGVGTDPTFRLFRFVIDMRMNNGLGGMDDSQTRIIRDHTSQQVACMLHANGKDTWIIARHWRSDSLVAMHLVDTGIVQTVYTKTGSPALVSNLGTPASPTEDSQLKSSPNSELLFNPRRRKEYPYHELYKFNRDSGIFSNPIYIPDTTKAGPFFYLNGNPDGAFSPDSKKLYVATGTRKNPNIESEGFGYFWQYNVESFDSASIVQSRKYLGVLGRINPNVAADDPFAPKLQLAMDGKIYVSPGVQFSDRWMSIIHCPNNEVSECQVKFREVDLTPGRNGYFFPTLNQTFVRNVGIFQLQANKRSICQGDTLELSAYGAGAEHFTWSVSPALPLGVKLDTLTWQKISTTTIPVGSYTFRCVGTSRCGDVYDKSMVVQIRPRPAKPTPTPAIPAGEHGIILCMYDTIRLSMPDTLAHYYWSTTDTTPAIDIVGWNASGTHWFTLITENQYGCQSLPSDSVAVTMKDVLPAPKPVIYSLPLVRSDSGFVALCPGDTVAVSTSGAHTYAWSDGNRNAIRYLTGSGALVLYGYDTAGCAAKAETEIRYKTLPNPQPVFIQGDTLLNLNSLSNQNYCVPLVPNHHYTWLATYGSITDTLADCATVNWNPGSVNRSLEVVQTSPVGCVGWAHLAINYRPDIRIPSLITPNNDGKNDVLVIQDLDYYTSHHLQLFDRWGKKVLNTSAYKQDWKGEPGIYFYNLAVDGNEFTGWVSVMK